MTATAGPRPVGRDQATSGFFDGTAQEQFLLMRCRPHGHWNRPQARRCTGCDSTELEPAPASGRGKLASWVVNHPRPDVEEPSPLTVSAIVELDEGPWWWALIVGADPAALRDGLPVEVRYERPAGSEAVPVFTPILGA